jgi:hypothetical protein
MDNKVDIIIADAATKSFKKFLVDRFKFWKYAFWEDIYYEFKWSFWALHKYFKIVKKMRPWDGSYIYEMTKFQLELLLPKIDNGHEEQVSRNKKVKDIKRLIELLNNYKEDNYSERCGYDSNFEFAVEKTNSLGYLLETNETPEQKENNRRAIKESYELEKKESKEIGLLMAKIPEWWD